MTLNIVQFCDDPQKIIHKTYPKNDHFLPPKNIEIQNFEQQKSDPSLHMYENIRAPPPPLVILTFLKYVGSTEFGDFVPTILLISSENLSPKQYQEMICKGIAFSCIYSLLARVNNLLREVVN